MWGSSRLWNLYDALIVSLAWADEIYILAMSSDLAWHWKAGLSDTGQLHAAHVALNVLIRYRLCRDVVLAVATYR